MPLKSHPSHLHVNPCALSVIEAQRRIYEVESLIPHRLQAGISADGKSLETVIKNDPVYILLAAVSLQLSSICLQSGLLSRVIRI